MVGRSKRQSWPIGRGDTRFKSDANFRAKLSILALSTMRGKSLFLFGNQAALATNSHFWTGCHLLIRPLNSMAHASRRQSRFAMAQYDPLEKKSL
jgi:hypothetical protein